MCFSGASFSFARQCTHAQISSLRMLSFAGVYHTGRYLGVRRNTGIPARHAPYGTPLVAAVLAYLPYKVRVRHGGPPAEHGRHKGQSCSYGKLLARGTKMVRRHSTPFSSFMNNMFAVHVVRSQHHMLPGSVHVKKNFRRGGQGSEGEAPRVHIRTCIAKSVVLPQSAADLR